MHPPIYDVCFADSTVFELLGTTDDAGKDAIRLYAFGEAEQIPTEVYAVWQLIGGVPENFLGNVPDMDSFVIQIDVYSMVPQQTRDAAKAIRDAIEPYAHVVAWNGEFRDPVRRSYRYSFTVEWYVGRE